MSDKMKRILIGILVAGCMLLIATSTVSAADYYISTDGSDSNSGTVSSPFKTVDHGVDQCDGGDTVYVKGGTYTGAITIDNSGYSSSYNTLKNYNGEDVTIKRSNIYDHGIVIDANYWIIDGFEITNTWHPVKVNNGHHDVEMRNLECHYNGYSLVMADGTYNMLIEDCDFYDPYSESTNFVGLRGEDDYISHHITIRDCTFDGCIHNSINFYTTQENEHYEGTTDVLIEGCSFSNGRQVAIFTNWCGVRRMTVRDCHFDHYARGIQAVMRDCLIEDCTVEDHGNFFVYTQADADSWDVTIRDITAHSSNWGNPSYCVDLKHGHSFEVYNIEATGDFSATSRPNQIPDPRNKDSTPNEPTNEYAWLLEWTGEDTDDGTEVTMKEMHNAVYHYIEEVPVREHVLSKEDITIVMNLCLLRT